MSSFKNILKTHKEAQEQDVEDQPPSSPAPAPEPEVQPKTKATRTTEKPTVAPKKRGRPAAKRSDPEFCQVTAYVKKTTHGNVQIALIKLGKEKDFSELVEELLSKWLKSPT